MCFVNENAVNAQFLEGHHIVFFLALRQPFQLGFQIFRGFLHLLDGKVAVFLLFRTLDRGNNIVDLILNDGFLPLRGQRDLLRLAVADDDGIIVAGGDPGAEFPTALGSKSFFVATSTFALG